MFKRVHHGHSLILGVILTLALERHMLLFAVLLFAAGLLTGRAWSFWADLARAVRMKLLAAPKRERIAFEPQPVYTASRTGARDLDEIPF